MPSRAYWMAVAFVRRRTAPLEAWYCGLLLSVPTRPSWDEMLMIDPPPARRMAGMAAFVPRNTPLALMSIVRVQSSTEGRHPGHAPGRRRVDHQHLVPARPGRDRQQQPAIPGLQGRRPPADEGDGHPVRARRHPRQLGSPRTDRDADDRAPPRRSRRAPADDLPDPARPVRRARRGRVWRPLSGLGRGRLRDRQRARHRRGLDRPMKTTMSRRSFLGGAAALTVAAGADVAGAVESRGTFNLPARGEFVIRSGYVMTMDPALGDIARGDVHVKNGAIVAVGAGLKAGGADA